MGGVVQRKGVDVGGEGAAGRGRSARQSGGPHN